MTIIKIIPLGLLLLCCYLTPHAQSISGRLIALTPPSIPNATQDDISVEEYLENGYTLRDSTANPKIGNAWWHHRAIIEVFVSGFPDSLYNKTRTDSLGFFRVSVPHKQECYIKIIPIDWGRLHPPFILKRVFTSEDVQLEFLPILTHMLGLSEYVARPIRRKFIFFGNWVYRIEHDPPGILNSFPKKKYRVTYKNRSVYLSLQQESEVDFHEIMHDYAINDSLGVFYDNRFPFWSDDFQNYIDRKRNLPPDPMPDTVAQVKIAFILFRDGSIGYPIVRETYDDWHSNEALRLFKTLPKFKPMTSSRRIPAEGRGNLIEVLEFNFSYPN